MEQYNRCLVISARILLATVFLLNGFGVINQTIPAKEVLEREVPPAIVPLAIIGGKEVEVIAGFWPGLRGLPTFTCLALFVFLVPAIFVSHSFWLAAGTPQFQGQLINFSKTWRLGWTSFVAGTASQPALFPRDDAEPARGNSERKTGAIHVEAE